MLQNSQSLPFLCRIRGSGYGTEKDRVMSEKRVTEMEHSLLLIPFNL